MVHPASEDGDGTVIAVFGLLALAFLLVPVAELYLVIKVGSAIGVLPTLLILVLISFVGAWLVKREGVAVLARAQRELGQGRVPTRELVDGVLVLAAGALLLTPGFLTDACGVLLLLPPVRAVVRRILTARLGRRAKDIASGASRPPGAGRFGFTRFTVVDLRTTIDPGGPRSADDVIDVHATEGDGPETPRGLRP